MEVKPYNQQSSKKEQVEAMFDNIAPNYDLLNRVLTLGIDTIWRKSAIKSIQKEKPSHILDIATGTADLAIEANKRINPDKITGIDISEEMLDFGRKKLEKLDLSEQNNLTKR